MMLERNLRVKLISFPDTEEMLFSLNNAVVYEIYKDFAIDFSVKRSNGIDPDTADITIWNMEAPDIYSGNSSQAEIYVGYGDSETLLYKGDITGMRHIKQGADRGIYITCGDTITAGLAQVSKGYAENVDYRNMINDIFDSFTKAGGEVVAGMKEKIYDVIQGKKTVSSVVLDTAKKSLADILSKTDKKPLFQNNQLYVVDRITGAIDDFTVILDNSNGLIGTPERGFAFEEIEEKTTVNGKEVVNKKLVKTQYLSFTCLIIPDIIVGRRVRIGELGDFVVQSVTVKGSTKGNDWLMTCEAK